MSLEVLGPGVVQVSDEDLDDPLKDVRAGVATIERCRAAFAEYGWLDPA